MPKLIDHQQRREEIAAAAWRVILRNGVAGASVRTVAAEAGLSAGSVRHVFGTQSELLAFAMRLVFTRVGARVVPLSPGRPAEEVAAELLPLDAERRAEMGVYVAMLTAANSEPGLREVRDEALEGMHNASRFVIALLEGAGGLPPEVDREYETVRLHALLDGLAAHLVWQAEDADTQWAHDVLVRHLRSLTSSDH